MKVAGNFEIHHFHVSVNGMDQLPHAKGLFFISSIGLALDRRNRDRVRDWLGLKVVYKLAIEL